MTVSRREAVELLGEADRAGRAVESRAPKEHLLFIGWGSFNAVVIPGFDVFDRAAWGWITIAIAVVGVVASFGYFARRSVQVEVKQRSPWWAWPAASGWITLAGLLAWALDGRSAIAYTVGGLMGGLPLIAWGLRLRARR